jgi:hypothetical protein
MVMKRFLLVAAVMVSASACNKPALDDCRRAISNMQKLLGTDIAGKNSDIEGDVRRCKGGSSQEAVACAIKASSLAELKACDFMGTKSNKK